MHITWNAGWTPQLGLMLWRIYPAHVRNRKMIPRSQARGLATTPFFSDIYIYIKYIYSENDITISRGILPCLNSRPTECLISASRVESTAKKTFGILCQFQILKPTIPNKYVYLRFRRKKSFKKCQFQFHCFYQSN